MSTPPPDHHSPNSLLPIPAPNSASPSQCYQPIHVQLVTSRPIVNAFRVAWRWVVRGVPSSTQRSVQRWRRPRRGDRPTNLQATGVHARCLRQHRNGAPHEYGRCHRCTPLEEVSRGSCRCHQSTHAWRLKI